MAIRNIAFEEKIDNFSQKLLDEHILPGITTLKSLVNFALGEIIRQYYPDFLETKMEVSK
jgi:hypothetical protein